MTRQELLDLHEKAVELSDAVDAAVDEGHWPHCELGTSQDSLCTCPFPVILDAAYHAIYTCAELVRARRFVAEKGQDQ